MNPLSINQPSDKSQRNMARRQPRLFCDGPFSEAHPSSPKRQRVSDSQRTLRCSISNCHSMKWPQSARSIKIVGSTILVTSAKQRSTRSARFMSESDLRSMSLNQQASLHSVSSTEFMPQACFQIGILEFEAASIQHLGDNPGAPQQQIVRHFSQHDFGNEGWQGK